MWSMKTIGGLTHGREIKWVQGLPSAHDVCETVGEYCDIYMTYSEQHIPNLTK